MLHGTTFKDDFLRGMQQSLRGKLSRVTGPLQRILALAKRCEFLITHQKLATLIMTAMLFSYFH